MSKITDEVLQTQLEDLVKNAADGAVIPELGEAGSDYIRSEVREAGFARSIFDFKPVTARDLDRTTDETSHIIYEMEAAQQRAKIVSFDGQPDASNYYARKFTVVFTKQTTPEWTKNIMELLTYRMDLRKVVTDNSLNDLERLEDERLIAEVDTICSSVGGNGLAGVPQFEEVAGGITRDTYKEILKPLENRPRPLQNGLFLMNRSTSKAFLGWGRDEIGGDLAERLMKEGTKALEKGVVMGVPHAFTIKRSVVDDNFVYHFAPQSMLGKACELRSPQMVVKKEHDILRMRAEEIIGLSFANVAGVHKTHFVS